ncbi:MAG: A/G-specific adenine glycosylase [Bryobacteraceae bacterium]
MVKTFAGALLDWYGRAGRDLPWRRSRDPWRILVSEIMLQQTRARTVIPYYERFLARYPAAAALARARPAAVLSAWSGLGYYSRARNLQRAARHIAAAGFPRTYDQIRGLPGVGDYTAAAVGSIAFGLRHAAVDGNVLRVVARVTADSSDIGSAATRARVREWCERRMARRDPAAFNQALMELGATVCHPRQPSCHECPVARWCEARAAGLERQLPVKRRPAAPVEIRQTIRVFEREGKILLRRRGAAESPMAGFWELPVVESPAGRQSVSFRHSIMNRRYAFTVECPREAAIPEGCRWIRRDGLARLPLTTVAKKALRFIRASTRSASSQPGRPKESRPRSAPSPSGSRRR